MDKKYFKKLRECFRSKVPEKIESQLEPLIIEIKNNNLLENKLRFHPLGFLYIKLFQFQNEETLRMHFWLKENNIQKPLMDIHNHFYHVNSYVFQGKLINRLYEVSEESKTHALYTGTYKNNTERVLTRTNEFKNLILSKEVNIYTKELYRIDKSQIHSGDRLGSDFTVSIVYTENPGNPNPLVFGPIDGENKYTYESEVVPNNLIDIVKSNLTMPNIGSIK